MKTSGQILDVLNKLSLEREPNVKITFKKDSIAGLESLQKLLVSKKISLSNSDKRYIDAIQIAGQWEEGSSREFILEVTEGFNKDEFVTLFLDFLETISIPYATKDYLYEDVEE